MADSSPTIEALSKYLAEARQPDSGWTGYQCNVLEEMINARDVNIISAWESHSTEQSAMLQKALYQAILEYLDTTWQSLFRDCTTNKGKKLSKEERAAMGVSKASLVYGEVSFVSLGINMWGPHVQLKPGGVFYDLGSGTGRGVFCGALLHDFDKCVGIEILEGLYNASTEILEKWKTDVAPRLSDDRKSLDISMHHGSFLEYDWSDADFIFANSTCFDEVLMSSIAAKAAKLKKGTTVITLTKSLQSDHFDLRYSKQHKMSWGYATVHIQVKTTDPVADDVSGAADGLGNLDIQS